MKAGHGLNSTRLTAGAFANAFGSDALLRRSGHRQRKQRLVFSAPTEANRQLFALQKQIAEMPWQAQSIDTPRIEARSEYHQLLAVKLRNFCEAVYAEPRYLDTGRTRWLQSLLAEAQTIAAGIKDPRIDQPMARVVAHAKRRKYFWARSEE